MENKMEQVAKLLGVELGEEFNIEGRDVSNPYIITNGNVIIDGIGTPSYTTLGKLLCGKLTIEKTPFKPNLCDNYYYVDFDGQTVITVWDGTAHHYYNYNANNCFRTSEEITEEDRKRIVEEMRGKYDGK